MPKFQKPKILGLNFYRLALGIFLFSASGVFFGPPAQAAPVTQEYTIQLKAPEDFAVLQAVGQKIQQRFGFNSAIGFRNIYTFFSPESQAQLQQQLQGRFNYLEADRQIHNQQVILNDPGFTSNVQEVDKQWAIPKVGFDKAWSKTVGSKNNVVSVIDTGIDATHQDLSAINFVPGYNFLSRQDIPVFANSDDNGHGTLVAGILGATANNGIGIVGTNWAISLMSLKTLDSQGKGDVSSVAEAIVWASDHGANFINLSIGGVGFGHDVTLANAISYAFNKGAVIAAAAGNDAAVAGGNLDQNPVYPICDDNNSNMVIGVAATDQNDIKPAFSNYGKNCVDVTAPGKRILSTISLDPTSKQAAPNSYAYASGTSLAVPFVIGQAALIKALYPTASNIQIRDRIISTADNIDSVNPTQCGGNSCLGLLGSGRINVEKSLLGEIVPAVSEGDLVRAADLSVAYQITGGQKRLVSQFVLSQRFAFTPIKTISQGQLGLYPDGPYATPLEGTLVKYSQSPTVYQMAGGQKLPITGQIFKTRGYSFASVHSLSDPELNSWITGNFLAPPEGTLVKIPGLQTLYWVVNGIMHPINFAFYQDRGLAIFPVITISRQDFTHYSQGEAYIR